MGDLTDDQLGELGGALYDQLTGNEDNMTRPRSPERTEFLSDVLSTALEGGVAAYHVTVDHAGIEGGYLQLLISALVIPKHCRTVGMAGQCKLLRSIDRPAKGWTVGELRTLAGLWDRWHLNGMRAACVHQSADAGLDSEPCPVSGYQWGHAWLTDPLPVEVVEQVRAFADRLDGSTPE